MMASQFLVKELGISKSCELLGIPRRTYYRLKLHRDRNSRTNTSRIPETVVTKIIELCKEHVTYGYRRIWARLRNEGISINRKTVMNIMGSNNLLLNPHARRKKSRNELTKAHYPDQVWETDLTYIHTQNEGMTYLFNVKDTFTKEWMGYLYSRTCNRFDDLMSIENALIRNPERYSDGKVKDTILRCDNGDQYTSHYFKDRIKLLGFTIEFIEKITPQQNGDVESFHNSLKTDYVWLDDFIDFHDAEKKIALAFHDYNNMRPHSSVDYLPPSVFRNRFMNDRSFKMKYIENMKKKEERMKLRREKRGKAEIKIEVKTEYA